jgi:hypothetical protein
MGARPTLKHPEANVLHWLTELCSLETCIGFDMVVERTRLSRAEVRRHCRSLARRGLARYERGLWSEDGDRPRGAGYGPTKAGVAWIEAQNLAGVG